MIADKHLIASALYVANLPIIVSTGRTTLEKELKPAVGG